MGFDAPEWGDLLRGVRPGYDPLVDDLPRLSTRFLADTIWPTLDVPHQALMRLQQGTMAGIPFTCMPLSSESQFQPQEFRVLLLRRLWLPLPLSSSICHVAVHLTQVATITQLVRWWGFWDAGVCSGKCSGKGLPRGRRTSDRERQSARDGPSLPLRQVDKCRLEVVVDGLRLFPSTPRWSAPRPTELRCCRHEGVKRGHTQSSLGTWGGPDWWYLVARSAEGGPLRPAVS